MIGIDMTRISRFDNARPELVQIVLAKSELAAYDAAANKAAFLAARWAIKEALFKANNALTPFSNLAIQQQDKSYSFPGYAISTSAEDDYYIAMVWKVTDAR